jgi:hypothetical protein
MNLRIAISPQGRLLCESATPLPDLESPAVDTPEDEGAEGFRRAFAISPADGLLSLIESRSGNPLPPDFLFWRDWTRSYFDSVSRLDLDQLKLMESSARARSRDAIAGPPPADDLALAVEISNAPPMRGLEYLTPDVLKSLWQELNELVARRAAQTESGLPGLLLAINPNRHLLGRVTFHLAENKRDTSRPFAFLATYAHRLSAGAKVQHLPLAQALKQYAGEGDQSRLVELLTPVRTAADGSAIIKELLQSRQLFQPQAWTISQAYRFLKDIPVMEQSGLIVRVPDWWKARKPPRPQVQVRVGDRQASSIGLGGMLDFSVDVVLEGDPLTDAERRDLLAASDGLVLLRGKWVEINHSQLQQALSHWTDLQRSRANGIDFLHGMRLLSGMTLDGTDIALADGAEWVGVTAGAWLQSTLSHLREPEGVAGCQPGDGLQATLRPYQSDGVRWLWFMVRLGLGACLADDMGLGKTIQVIDLLLRLRADASDSSMGTVRSNRSRKQNLDKVPSLLIVPASLIGNWSQELARFAPQLAVCFLHRSECDADTLARISSEPQKELAGFDLVVTTYTLARNARWIAEINWNLIILDEAQAIKNVSSAQTRAVKGLKGSGRLVLTGTPVENHLGDLWSLFDFCCPGLLGSTRQFKEFVKRMEKSQDANAYGPLRRLVQPYILRRLKTDPRIVPDLPEKTEMRIECSLSRRQAVLYEQLLKELELQLSEVEGIQRRGLVLAMLMKLKQICNHPAQYLNQSDFLESDSGKFLRLAQICGPIVERQEKVLVFTQFQSLCDPLTKYLSSIFGQPGLTLHGGVAVARRKELVRQFQEDAGFPFLVISVKAGGTGLNLTAASHVVHFDRWWNPAVENQATDRAFRIGQKRNVLVHKFVCRGTLEEQIDRMIQDKQEVANQILGKSGEGETLLTEMSDRELLNFVALDISRASAESD